MTPRDESAPNVPFDEVRLKRLIADYCEGALEASEHAELENALRSHRTARTLYLAYLQVDAGLDWRLRGRQKLETLVGLTSRETRSATAAPQADERAARRKRRKALVAALVVAASLVIAFGLLLQNSAQLKDEAVVRRDSDGHRIQAAEASARIVELSDDCRWFVENRGGRQGVANAGDTIRLTQGQLKVEFSCGATITMRSPAALQVISPMHARAVLGTLTAHVNEEAEGFTVDTPRTTVVDLGTDFGIDVSDHGSTDVVVFNGAVDLQYDGETGQRSRRRLVAGEGIRVDGEGTASRIVSILESQYAVDAPATVRKPVISAVADNMTRGESWHYYEIVHGGMREDAKAYVDRKDHEWNGLDAAGMPSYLLGGDYVKTFNDDKLNSMVQIRITLDRPAMLYVLIDNRTRPPQWLQDYFRDTGDDVGIDGGGYTRGDVERTTSAGPGLSIDDQFSVWRREAPATGVVELGAIVVNGTQNNMYGIVAVPIE